MPAYFIAVRNSVTNPDEMTTYNGKVRTSIKLHPMKFLAAYGKIRSGDGKSTDGAVVVEFESFEAAEAWYDSPEYQDALQHRVKGGDYQTFIVQGL